jgi:hypothetical protein
MKCALVVMILQGAFVTSYAQTGIAIPPNSGVVAANFGLDADLYANKLQFGHFTFNTGIFPWEDSSEAGTDDYWKNIPGIGIAVVDTVDFNTGQTATSFYNSLLDCGTNNLCTNKSFFVRMNSAYQSFDVVHGPTPTVGAPDTRHPVALLDAIGYRDYHYNNGNPDSSSFLQSNKFWDDPRHWNLGPGAVADKGDIIDLAAHLRVDLLPTTFGALLSLAGTLLPAMPTWILKIM